MKKILLLLIAVVLALTVVCVPSFAEEVEGGATEPAEEETAVDEEIEASGEKAFADNVAAFFSSHSSEIFGGISTLLGAVLLCLFKKGLIPSTATALGTINAVVDSAAAKLDGKTDEISKTLTDTLSQVQPFLDNAVALTAELQTVKAEKEAQVKIDKAVFDLLGLIVESGRIPESVKEQYRLYKVSVDGEIKALEAKKGE